LFFHKVCSTRQQTQQKKCKKYPSEQLSKVQNLTMSQITAAIDDSLNGLLDDIREECILAIKNKRNQNFCNW
jgi:hypothetical protein